MSNYVKGAGGVQVGFWASVSIAQKVGTARVRRPIGFQLPPLPPMSLQRPYTLFLQDKAKTRKISTAPLFTSNTDNPTSNLRF